MEGQGTRLQPKAKLGTPEITAPAVALSKPRAKPISGDVWAISKEPG